MSSMATNTAACGAGGKRAAWNLKRAFPQESGLSHGHSGNSLSMVRIGLSKPQHLSGSSWLCLSFQMESFFRWKCFDSTIEREGHINLPKHLYCSNCRIRESDIRDKDKKWLQTWNGKECFVNCDFILHYYGFKFSFDNYLLSQGIKMLRQVLSLLLI